MRILFLDFDGLIITWRSHFSRPDWANKSWEQHDIVTTNFLINLIKMSAGPLRIVVSSSWRFNKDTCHELLRKTGLIDYLHDDWRTTTYENVSRKVLVPEALARGGEINEWLNRHPEVKDYKILDDDNDILPKQWDNFVKCDAWDGLGGKDMKMLMNWAKTYKD